MDDVADFIVKDCESAIEKLPLKYESSDDLDALPGELLWQ